MPVLNSEVNYEGIMSSCYDDVQRLAFWACVLSGAAGHTYGANGIWQMNTADKPYGPSPHGNNWGNRPWDEAMRLPGSAQVAVGKRILEQFEWWKFTPHQEWVQPSSTEADAFLPYAAGIPRVQRCGLFTHSGRFGDKVFQCVATNMESTIPPVLSTQSLATSICSAGRN